MNKYKALIIILAAFLLMRLAVLFFFIQHTFQCEELLQGAIAKEIMGGTGLPLLEYQATPYSGGSLLDAIITIPFFAVFGANLFALKLVPLFFSAVTLALLFLFAWRHFNPRTAYITAFLFILASPLWIAATLANEGSHAESLVFTVAALFLFYEIIFKRKTKPIYYFSFGFICGMGLYWIYTFLLTLGLILLIWFRHDKKIFFSKGFYLFWLGLLAWMIPWLGYNLTNGFKGPRDVFSVFLEPDYSSTKAWVDAVSRFLRNVRFTRMLDLAGIGGLSYNLLNRAWLLLYWAGFIFILKSCKFSLKMLLFSKESFVAIFPLSLLIVASIYGIDPGESAYFMDWIYLVPILPFVFLTTAIILDRLVFKIAYLKYVCVAVLFISVISGSASYCGKMRRSEFAAGFREPGYSYKYLSWCFISKYPSNLYKIMDDITRVKNPQQREVIGQILIIEVCDEPAPLDFREYVKLTRRLEDRSKPYFYKTLIKGLYGNSDIELGQLVKQVDGFSLYVEEKFRPSLYEGIGAVMVKRYPDDTLKFKEGALFMQEKYRPYYYRGMAHPFYVGWQTQGNSEHAERFRSCLSWLPEEYKPLFLEGAGETLSNIGFSDIADKSYPGTEDAQVIYDFTQTLEPRYRRHVLEGMGKNLSYIIQPGNEQFVYQFINNLKTEEEKNLVLGILRDNLKHVQ